jgi:hypothetical protein
MTTCACKPNCSLDEDLEILLPHVHQAQQWQCEVFLVIAMKVCDNNRLPWCDDGDFEGFHLWITFVKDDSRAPLKGKWFTMFFKLKMRCCSYMH